ncbi:MAG: permease, partial [Deltaproteobacteria bacterium]|nr:permease [Deltaproteobacteria bacterium]
IVVLHILPTSIALGGGWGAAAAGLGLVAPAVIERRREEGRAMPRVLLWPAIAGLAVHALLDGAALVAGSAHAQHEHVSMLAAAVLLHRLPFGLTIWWVLRPRLGPRIGWGVIVAMSVATVAGYLAAGELAESTPRSALAVFQALVAGSLLHVVVGHQPRALVEVTTRGRWLATAGAVLGGATLVALAHDHPVVSAAAGELAAGLTFVTLSSLSAPALVVGLALGALAWWVVPVRPTSWLTQGGTMSRAFKGMVHSLPLPLASCDVLPAYRRLFLAGVPAAAAMAFLLATPQVGLEALALSVPLLGAPLALVRLLLALGVALTVVVVVVVLARPAAAADGARAQAPPDSSCPRCSFLATLRGALVDRLEHLAPWMVVGFVVAALIEPLVDGQRLSQLPPELAVGLAAVLGLLGYVPALGALPVVAVLLHKGLSPGAGVAFLITGPTVSLTSLAVLAELHGRGRALLVGIGVPLITTIVGLAIDQLGLAHDPSALHDAAARGPTMVETAAGVVMAALVLGSLLRQGPRAAVAKVFNPRDHAGHHHHGQPIRELADHSEDVGV